MYQPIDVRLMACRVTVSLYCFLLILQSSMPKDFVSTCIREIAETYISPGIISVHYPPPEESSVCDHVDDVISSLMDGAQWSMEMTPSIVLPIPPINQVKIHPHSGVIIFLGLAESWKRIIAMVFSRRFLDPQTKLLILMKDIADFDILVKALQYVWLELRLFNYHGLLINDKNITIFSVDIFSLEVYLVGTWTGHPEARELLLFPDVVTPNFNNFTLRLLHINLGYTSYGTTCINNIKAIAASLKMPVRLSSLVVAEWENYLSANGEWNGLMWFLNKQEADAVCAEGYYLSPELYHWSEPLPAIFHQHALLAVNKKELVTGWRVIVIEFSWTVWVNIFAVWLFSSAVFYVCDLTTGNRKPFLKVFFAIYGLHLDNPPATLGGFRRVYWMILLYLLVVTTAYKSKLVSFVTDPPREAQIRTLEEGVASGYSIYLFRRDERWFRINEKFDSGFSAAAKLGKVVLYERLNDVFRIIQTNPRVIRVEDRSLEIGTYLFKAKKIPFIERLLQTYDYLEGNFYERQDCVYMSPANPLLPIFKKKQQYVIESGLILYWEAARLHLKGVVISMREPKLPYVPSTEARPISLSQVSTFFSLYLIFVSVCFFCFILENVFWVVLFNWSLLLNAWTNIQF